MSGTPRPPDFRWQRASSVRLATRLHQAQLRELADAFSPDEFAAVLDAFERLQQHERQRLTRWKAA
jgi:hypothetical protein